MDGRCADLTEAECDVLFRLVASELGERHILQARWRRLSIDPDPRELHESETLATILVKLTPRSHNKHGAP